MKYNLRHPKRLFGNVYWWWSLLSGVDYGVVHCRRDKMGEVFIDDRRVSFKRIIPCFYKRVEPPGMWINY